MEGIGSILFLNIKILKYDLKRKKVQRRNISPKVFLSDQTTYMLTIGGNGNGLPGK